MNRLLVADDDAVIRALRLARETRPDLAILDWFMPLLNGFDAACRMLAASPRLAVLLFTAFPDEQLVYRALRAGVRGFVLKNRVTIELVEAVTCIAAGQVYLSEGLEPLVEDEPATADRVRPDKLSLREREVVQLVAESKQTKEIADILGLSVKTVEHHRTRLMEKLDIHDIAGLTRYAIREFLIRPY